MIKFLKSEYFIYLIILALAVFIISYEWPTKYKAPEPIFAEDQFWKCDNSEIFKIHKQYGHVSQRSSSLKWKIIHDFRMNRIIDSIGEPGIIINYTTYKYDKINQVLTIICPQDKYDIEWEKAKDSNYGGFARIGCIIDKITLDFVTTTIEFIYNPSSGLPSTGLNSTKTQCTPFKP